MEQDRQKSESERGATETEKPERLKSERDRRARETEERE